MGKYQGYDKYKDSGVEWLGEIPEHWELVRFSHFINFQEGPGIMAADFKDDGVPLLRIHNLKPGFVNLEGCNYLDPNKVEKTWKHFKLKQDDLLISCSASTGLVSVVDKKAENSIAYTGIIRLNPANSNICREFIKIIVSSELFFTQIELLKTGTTIQHYGPIHLRQIKITLPPLDEQEKIARFLDYKTKQIDKLIAKKETLIEKLDEKRTSLISHAVTKGLDVNVPMKDSGIEWLGEIPKHWEVKNLRYICEFLNKRRIPLSSEERGSMSDKIYPYYGASGIIDYVENFIFDEPTILIAEDGANLLSRSTPLAFIAEGKYWVNNHAHILKPFSGNFKYWANLLCIIEYDYWITGSAQPKLTKDNLGSIKLADPPVQEQQKIAEYLDKKTAQIEEQKTKIQQAIDVLKEYRTALITNAVTGKINVSQVDIP